MHIFFSKYYSAEKVFGNITMYSFIEEKATATMQRKVKIKVLFIYFQSGPPPLTDSSQGLSSSHDSQKALKCKFTHSAYM